MSAASKPSGAATTITITLTSTVAVGDFCVVFGAMWASSTTNVSAVSDNGPGNTWAIDANGDVFGAPHGWIVRDDGTGIASGTVITVTFDASVDGRVARAYSIPGVDLTTPKVTDGLLGAAGPTWTSSAHTVATDNALFTVAYNESGVAGSTPSAGTEIFDDTDTYGNGFVAHWQLGTGVSITNAGAWGSGGGNIGTASVVYAASAGAPEWPPADTPPAPPLRVVRSNLRLG